MSSEKCLNVTNYLLKHPISQRGDYAKVGVKFGVDGEYVRGVWRRINKKDSYSKKETTNTITTSAQYDVQNYVNNTREVQKLVDNKIKTLEELVKICEIDLSIWKVDKYICNTWGELFQVKAFLSLKKGQEAINYKKEFENFLNKKNIKPVKVAPVFKLTNGNTLIINSADLHLGKLASKEEVGEDYDIDIACDRFLTTLTDLLYKASQGHTFEKIIFSSLGDALHVDNTKSTTTSGTYVESDTRASKIFSTALDLFTSAINICKAYAKNVEWININGNHCELSEQHLGIAIKAYFRNDKNVFIDAEPKNRKYRLIGSNLLVYCHGDTQINTLPLAIATENPEMWGKSKYRIVQLGHLHQSKKRIYQSEDEFNGVTVRHFSSLCSSDFWHDRNSYIQANKKATALVFNNKEIGIVAEFNSTIK